MNKDLGLSRARLRWLTIFGPALYLSALAVAVLYTHPHPLPPFWPAFVVFLAVSIAGTYIFSAFVFAHVQRQEEEIARQTRELAEMNEAMATVKERQRIARELHDTLAQTLGYLHLKLAAAEQQLGAGEIGQVQAELADLKKTARAAYEEARQAIFGLRSMVSRSLGLVPTLTEYLHDWSRQTGIAVDLKVDTEETIALPLVAEVQLIGILQEAMTNVRKHAGARRVVVGLNGNHRYARLSIDDDGVGFEPAALGKDREHSFGIDTMRERAEAAGGTLTVTSRPGGGTRVEVQLRKDATAARPR